MNAAYQWFMAHPWMLAGLTTFGYHVGSAFVGALPMPDTSSGKFYRFCFAFFNALAANYARAKASNGAAGNQPPKA